MKLLALSDRGYCAFPLSEPIVYSSNLDGPKTLSSTNTQSNSGNLFPTAVMSTQTSRTPATNRLSTVPTSASKSRQLSHLHAQLAQLTAHMSDLENLLRMTSVQAEGMRGLGGYAGGM